MHIAGAMHSAGSFEFDIGKGLHAKADAVDSQGYPGVGFLRIDGLRIGFQRHFGKVGLENPANCVQHAGQLGRPKQAGRSASEVNRVHRQRGKGSGKRNASACKPRLEFMNLGLHGGSVGGKPRGRNNTGVEIAIGAFCLAKRHLNVATETHEPKKTLAHSRGALRPGGRTSAVYFGSGTTLTKTVRWRGPSNSQRKIPCQVPSANLPPSTRTV